MLFRPNPIENAVKIKMSLKAYTSDPLSFILVNPRVGYGIVNPPSMGMVTPVI